MGGCTDHPTKVLKPFQTRVAKQLTKPGVGGILVLHKTGSGKSLIAAAAAACALKKSAAVVLVITRKSVVQSLEATIGIQLAHHKLKPGAVFVGTHSQVYRKASGMSKPALKRALVIVDEAHLYHNTTSRLYKQLKDLRERCHKVLLMTATPMTTDRNDVITLLGLTREENGRLMPGSAKRQAASEMKELREYAATLADVTPEIDEGCDADSAYFTLPADRSTAHLTEAQRLYLKSLPAVPPAYNEVFVCRPGSRVMFAGRDSAGRKQAKYSVSYTQLQKQTRDNRVLSTMAHPKFMPALVALAQKDASSKDDAPTRALGVCVLVLARCSFRLMHSKKSTHFGLATLEVQHYLPKARRIEFVGKSGQRNTCELPPVLNKHVQRLVQEARRSGRKRVFPADITASRVNTYLKALVGRLKQKRWITAKDFRTFAANTTFLEHIVEAHPPLSTMKALERKAVVQEAASAVSAVLNNTPAVAKKEYVSQELVCFVALCPVQFDALAAQNTDTLLWRVHKHMQAKGLGKLLRRIANSLEHEGGRRSMRSYVTDAQLVAMATGVVSVHFPDQGKDDANTASITYAIQRLAMQPATERAYRKLIASPGGEGAFRLRSRQFAAESDEKLQWVRENVAKWKRAGETPYLVYVERKSTLAMVLKTIRGTGARVAAIDGSASASKREAIVAQVNSRALDGVVITEAGAEGVDYVGLRHVVLVTIPWTFARFDQVNGRGPRTGAHAHLPPKDRKVQSHALVLVDRHGDGVDTDVLSTMQSRSARRDELMDVLTPHSIA